jgi:dTDP-4-amino-4,6-dideoxygalactose transaminase
VPLVDLRAQYVAIQDEIDDAIRRVLDNTSFILGPEVQRFERAFATFLGADEVVGVSSGTSALHLSLVACGVGPGDEVITSPLTFIATAEAISQTGARPVFADIDPVTFTLDPDLVEAAVSPRTRAIVPVHLYGHPAEMDALLDIARRHDLRVVEDAAQAHGAEYLGRRCGTLGDLAAFSFYPGKNLGAYGDAGAVSGTSGDPLARVRKLRDHGRTTKYEHDEIGYGERLDALQAAILDVKLRHLDAWTDARRTRAAAYRATLQDTPLQLPEERSWARHAYHLFVVRSAVRDDLLAALVGQGIGAGIHYPIPLHLQPAYADLEAGPFPEAERAATEVLSLPLFPELTDAQIEHVAEVVKSFFGS